MEPKDAGIQRPKTPDIVAKLEAENEELRRQLAALRSTGTTSHKPTASSDTSAAVTPSNEPVNSIPTSTTVASDGSRCRGNCPKILRRYHALSANFKTAKDALQRRKDERNKWVQYSVYLNKRITAAEEQYGIQILDQKAQHMEAPPSTALEADEAILNPSLSFMSNEGPEDGEPQLPELLPARQAAGDPFNVHHTNSETTQGEASDEISQPLPALLSTSGDVTAVIKQEPSSDIPEVVSEREVRKRKHTEELPGTIVMPRIKSELVNSSSPIMSISPMKFHTQESIDLGDIAQKIQTPRKRQMLDQEGPQSEMVPRSKYTTLTPVHAGVRQQPQSAIVPRQSSALMPLSVNARAVRPVAAKTQFKNRRQQLGEGIASLADDGAAYEALLPTDENRTPSFGSTKSRLGLLLDGPLAPAEDENIISRPLKRFEPRTPSGQADLGIPGRRQLPFDKEGQRSNKSTPSHRTSTSKPVREPKGVNRTIMGSLRTKPMSGLRLEDFKVNPQANDGHDFAFSEVVRDRGDRACLPGCVDMHCCGKEFRALAMSQRPNPPLTAVQRQEEQRFLEDHLGDYSYRLATMTKEERIECWIEAKTQELANKYGKHRHRYSRMQSPPGFWNADFPDTQQLEAEREEAARRAKRGVAERYREAMRPGGRWMFKDE